MTDQLLSQVTLTSQLSALKCRIKFRRRDVCISPQRNHPHKKILSKENSPALKTQRLIASILNSIWMAFEITTEVWFHKKNSYNENHLCLPSTHSWDGKQNFLKLECLCCMFVFSCLGFLAVLVFCFIFPLFLLVFGFFLACCTFAGFTGSSFLSHRCHPDATFKTMVP